MPRTAQAHHGDEVKSFKEELKNMKPEDFFKDLKKGKGPGAKDEPTT